MVIHFSPHHFSPSLAVKLIDHLASKEFFIRKDGLDHILATGIFAFQDDKGISNMCDTFVLIPIEIILKGLDNPFVLQIVFLKESVEVFSKPLLHPIN